MAKIQLTISPHYVNTWGTLQALRELMQNCIDRVNESPEAAIILSYEPLEETLIIGNRRSKLKLNTLLLGETSKANNKQAIGTYGEGYKLAFLVLLRNGISVEVENCSERWEPYFVKSRTFKAKVLTIKTSKGSDSNDLVFHLKGITPEVYNDFQNKCLYFHPNIETADTDYGRILRDERFAGEVYCEGLFVCKMADNLKFGYDMKASHCQLDRDRNKVQSFNLLWELGLLWASLPHAHAGEISEMVNDKFADVQYWESHVYHSGKLYQDVCDLQYNEFLKKHGKTAVFVKNEEQARHIKEKYNNRIPVILPEKKYVYCSDSPVYRSGSTTEKITREDTPYSLIEDFIKENKKTIFGTVKRVIEEKLLPQARNWRLR